MIPIQQLSQHPRGPAIWQVQDVSELLDAVQLLLNEPAQRRSQGNAAVHAAARIANGMLTIAWEVLIIMVLEPALAGIPAKAARKVLSNRSISPTGPTQPLDADTVENEEDENEEDENEEDENEEDENEEDQHDSENEMEITGHGLNSNRSNDNALSQG